MTDTAKHSIRYFGVTAIGERVPCTKGMKHSDWAWVATCAPCGWDSEREVTHKEIVGLVAEHKAGEPVVATPAAVNAAASSPEPTTKTPFKLYANGGMTIFSRKDRAVAAGDALGVTYTVVNPKGKVVASRVI